MDNLLQANNMLENGSIVKNSNLEIENQRQINSILNYFISSHDLNELKVLPDDFDIGKMEEVFGFKYEVYYPGIDGDQYFGYYLDIYEKPINIEGYDFYVQMSSWRNEATIVDDLSISYNPGDKLLTISDNTSDLIRLDIGKLALQVHESKELDFEGKNIVNLQDMTFDEENQDIRVRVIFTNINGYFRQATGSLEVENAEYILLIGR